MIWLIFIEAVSAIMAHKSRTLLTMLGIVIGIASVITVIAAGEGGKAIIMKEFEGLSPSSLFIYKNWNALSKDSTLKEEDLDSRDLDGIKRFAVHVKNASPIRSFRTLIRAGGYEKQLSVTGTNESYIEYSEYELEEGRVFTKDEVDSQAKVAVVGHAIKEEFFSGEEASGEYIEIFKMPVKIIGVLKKKEKTNTVSISNSEDETNNAVVVPITFFERSREGDSGYDMILCKAVSIKEIPDAKKEILKILAKNHGKWHGKIDKFMITGMQEQLKMINKVVGTITIGVALLAGIALLVAAIGIMNVMLVSVKERTREIGLRKAIGARKRHIMIQFLIETLILCGGGGVIGLAAASGAASLIASLAKWPVIINPSTVILAAGLSLFTGLVSGMYPAGKAASLIPHEALRYE